MDDNLYKKCFEHANTKIKTTSWNEIATEYGMTRDALRKKFYTEFKNRNNSELGELNEVIQSKSETKEIVRINADKTITSEKVVSLTEEELTDANSILEANGFDPKKFSLVSMTSSTWDGPGEGVKKYACKVTVKPKDSSQEITFEDIDNWFENFRPKIVTNFVAAYDKKDGYTLEVPYCDLHIGNHGADFKGVEEIVRRFYKTINELYEQASQYEIKKIIFAPLGDTLHYDGPSRSTSSGTQLDSAALDYTRIFDMAMEMFVHAIDKLSLLAPVEIIAISGNHDRVLGYFLIKTLESYYRNNPNVQVDASPGLKKFRKIGSSLLGLLHGDMGQSRLMNWIQNDARKEWAETVRAELHAGHLHSQGIVEKDGYIVRNLPSLCVEDAWHQNNNFVGSRKTLECFLWDDEIGVKEIWYFDP